MKKIRIGGGSGYAGDRVEPAIELLEDGDIQYLVFEALAERTIARENLKKLSDPSQGYSPLLEERMRRAIPIAKKKGIKIITNMGAANPESAADIICEIAKKLDIRDLKVAVIIGDDVKNVIKGYDTKLLETGQHLSTIEHKIESANAYLGADAIRDALNMDADIVLTGRMADPSLFLGPMLHEFDWDYGDYRLLGQGTVVGHLMECAGQVTGGYFADPGYKDIDGLDQLGFPIAEIYQDGTAYITKTENSGGEVSVATCKEQLLYEIHDPSEYITPDCIVDITGVSFTEVEKNRVQILGAKAKPRTSTYKVSLGYRNGHIGEGQMSYGGPGAVKRAELAADVVKSRLQQRGISYRDLAVNFIGIQSLHGEASATITNEPYEVRLRIAGITDDYKDAFYIGAEVETLLTNGPYGGAGDFKQVREIIAVLSILLPRNLVNTQIVIKELKDLLEGVQK